MALMVRTPTEHIRTRGVQRQSAATPSQDNGNGRKQFRNLPVNRPTALAAPAQTEWQVLLLGDRFLSSAAAGANCARPVKLPDPAQCWIKIMHPWVLKFYSVLGGAGLWRKAPMAFPVSSSVLDKFQSARLPDKHVRSDPTMRSPPWPEFPCQS